MNELKAVLWDMDGTLINSEPYWINAEFALTKKFNIPWSIRDGEKLKGVAIDIASKQFIDLGVKMSITDIQDYLNNKMIEQTKKEVIIQKGAIKLIEDLINNNIKNALVTSSYLCYANIVVDYLKKKYKKSFFETVITGDIIKNDKPHPGPYLTAAKNLNVNIKNCIGFEDSEVGAQSVQNSGAKLLGYHGVTKKSAESVKERSNALIISDWSKVSADDIIKYFQK